MYTWYVSHKKTNKQKWLHCNVGSLNERLPLQSVTYSIGMKQLFKTPRDEGVLVSWKSKRSEGIEDSQ